MIIEPRGKPVSGLAAATLSIFFLSQLINLYRNIYKFSTLEKKQVKKGNNLYKKNSLNYLFFYVLFLEVVCENKLYNRYLRDDLKCRL